MSVFSSIKPVNHTPKNGFDLSRFITFSSKVGPIAQVFSQLTLDDGTYELDLSQLCRTQPLQTAAFAGFTLNYDIQWMPLNHLYTSFNQFIAQREDKHIVNQPSHEYVPYTKLYNWVPFVCACALWDYIVSQCPDKYDLQNDPLGLPVYVITSEHSSDTSLAMSVITNLDLMGYGNFLPVIKSGFRFVNSWFEVQGLPYTAQNLIAFYKAQVNSGTDDPFDIINFLNYLKNFAHLGVDGTFNWTSGFYGYAIRNEQGEVTDGRAVTLWPVLAYNKCFYEYYRNVYYDLSYKLHFHNLGEDDVFEIPYVKLFNVDDFTRGLLDGVVDGDPGHAQQLLRLIAMFAQKPHLYKRDLFTAVLPDTQFGDVSVAMTDTDFRRLLGNSPNSIHNVDVLSGQVLSGGNTSEHNNVLENKVSRINSVYSDKFKFDPALAISVLELRRADSMQRFKERMLRAGERTKDIFKALGWSAPLSEKSYEPIFLGSYDGRLDINTVASTSRTADVDLGQLAANGVASVQGHKIKIHCKDFGILVVHFYIQKQAVYNSYGLDRQHCLLDPFDWPYPVLQNISFAPVIRGDLNMFPEYGERSTDIVGYEPRDMWAKTAVDRVCGEFFSDFPGDDFVQGVFSDWVTPRKDVKNMTDLSFLYIHPSCADQIFAQAAGVAPDTDQFLINCVFSCYAVEPLSVMNLPI